MHSCPWCRAACAYKCTDNAQTEAAAPIRLGHSQATTPPCSPQCCLYSSAMLKQSCVSICWRHVVAPAMRTCTAAGHICQAQNQADPLTHRLLLQCPARQTPLAHMSTVPPASAAH